MPRIYKHEPGKRNKWYDENVLKQAVEDYLMKTGEYIIQYINVCAEWGYPLNSLDFRYIVKIHKDKISQRICQNIKRSRAAVSAEIITKYFEELQISLADVPAANIVNYDETNLADDPGRRKLITKRSTKYPERVMNHTKASVSLMIAGSAEGQILPPCVVYKEQNLCNTWISHGPEGAWYNRSASGWFYGTIFEDWVQSIVISFFADKPDNLFSHLSVDMIKLCKEQQIDFVFLPNATKVLSPIPTQSNNSSRHREAVDESALTLLNDMRYTMGVKELKRKWKLDVVAGKSVSESTEDYVDFEVTPGPHDLECGGKLTIENYPLRDLLIINPTAAGENIETGLNNVSQSDHAGESNCRFHEEEYSVAEVVTETLPKTKKEK
ncbi:unnamed protein product [Parnassius apollo]|uniref:(apollo) hypothetical protein n=1 Tax=Parnassius apollo TaxID=110799 RepID=A0A8S3WGD1_PARAO|nr:unnamed protein product [Parnassius apollo]